MIFARSELDEDEIEEDEGTLQRRAFPIGEPSSRVGDDSLPPEDGLEYLRRVRVQQRELPATVTVKVSPDRLARHAKPSAATTPEKPVPPVISSAPRKGLLAALAASPLPPPPLPPALQPRAAWQRKLLAEFAALRGQVEQRQHRPTTAVVAKFDIPDANDSHGWEAWCGLTGRDTAAVRSGGGGGGGGSSNGNGGGSSNGNGGSKEGHGSERRPTVRSVSSLDQQRITGLLRALQLALQRRCEGGGEGGGEGSGEAGGGEAGGGGGDDGGGGVGGGGGEGGGSGEGGGGSSKDGGGGSGGGSRGGSRGVDRHCQWVFAALACLGSAQLLDPDVCACVRGLFTACVEWRARMLLGWRRDAASNGEAAGREAAAREAAGMEEVEAEERARQLAALHTLVTICGGFFKQAPSEEWQGAEEQEEEEEEG